MSTQTEKQLYEMLTTSTGRALCDSGDAYGRNWERNQKLTIDDFINSAPATLEIVKYDDGFQFSATISLFHRLNNCLELDSLCEKFNSKKVNDWDGDYYGTSASGYKWIKAAGLAPDDDAIGAAGGFNSYNFDNVLSQVIQGHFLRSDDNGDKYLLLQIHQGCDVRGGYTDAKLFKLRQWVESWNIFEDTAFFMLNDKGLDFNIDGFTNEEGEPLTQDQLNIEAAAEFSDLAELPNERQRKVLRGDICNY